MEETITNGETQMTPDHLLLQQNLALRQEIKELKAIHQNVWLLLVVISRRLQISSASVKAAVTSLLNHDIFWDISTQHEFLQTIENSTDNLSDLAMLVSLVSRLQVDKIHLRLEPQTLQEILSKLEDDLSQRIETLKLDIEFPREGDSVLVDYEYLMIALRLLFESMAETQGLPITVRVVVEEKAEYWQLEILDITPEVHKVICNLSSSLTEEFIKAEQISAERTLMIYTAFKIFDLQKIQLQACQDKKGSAVLQLTIPFAGKLLN